MIDRYKPLFFQRGASYQQHSMKKISWRRYARGVFLSVIVMGLILVGIFCHSVVGSVISIAVLGILTVISAMKYE